MGGFPGKVIKFFKIGCNKKCTKITAAQFCVPTKTSCVKTSCLFSSTFFLQFTWMWKFIFTITKKVTNRALLKPWFTPVLMHYCPLPHVFNPWATRTQWFMYYAYWKKRITLQLYMSCTVVNRLIQIFNKWDKPSVAYYYSLMQMLSFNNIGIFCFLTWDC